MTTSVFHLVAGYVALEGPVSPVSLFFFLFRLVRAVVTFIIVRAAEFEGVSASVAARAIGRFIVKVTFLLIV